MLDKTQKKGSTKHKKKNAFFCFVLTYSYLCHQNKTSMKHIWTLAAALLLLSSCNKSDDDNTEKKDTIGDRTVVVYMSGENNLSALTNSDIEEMTAGAKNLPDSKRLIVFVDRADSRKKPFIARINSSSTTSRIDTLYQYPEDFYASSADRFYEVLQRATQLAPAKEYGLVLWGHANGWFIESDSVKTELRRAYGVDNGNNTTNGGQPKWLNIPSMRLALEKLGIDWQFVFADCCNMMCAEVGYELRNVTRYFIGSPAEIPSSGAPYHELVPVFFMSGNSLCHGIVDNYFNHYKNVYSQKPQIDVNGVSVPEELSGHSVPLTVFDTQYAEPLARATRDVVAKIAATHSELPDLAEIPYYLDVVSPVMYDMKAFIRHYAPESDYQSWLAVFSQAVPYSHASLRWMTIYESLYNAFGSFSRDESVYGCISMYIPQDLPGYNAGSSQYNKTAENMEWNRVIGWSQYGW